MPNMPLNQGMMPAPMRQPQMMPLPQQPPMMMPPQQNIPPHIIEYQQNGYKLIPAVVPNNPNYKG